MSVSSISDKNKFILWAISAGYCEYEGCPVRLWIDPTTKSQFNMAYIAHIIADKPDGPRGDSILSPQLANDISNLMLLCDIHHRLVDKTDVANHSVERLTRMKREHEDRIRRLTSLSPNKQSHILLYGSNIGNHSSPLTYQTALAALMYEKYPADDRPIEFSMINSSIQDDAPLYWQTQNEHLENEYNNKLKPRITTGEIQHLSIFAIAPQPLLIKLGHLISDLQAGEVYQLHREPPNWSWQDEMPNFQYLIIPPENTKHDPVLNLSLSANIDNRRIYSVLGRDISIWTITIENPNNDFVKSRIQTRQFREVIRDLFNQIKLLHKTSNSISVFPAMPVSLAVDLGRVIMPKADLPLIIYDQNNVLGGFTQAITVGGK